MYQYNTAHPRKDSSIQATVVLSSHRQSDSFVVSIACPLAVAYFST